MGQESSQHHGPGKHVGKAAGSQPLSPGDPGKAEAWGCTSSEVPAQPGQLQSAGSLLAASNLRTGSSGQSWPLSWVACHSLKTKEESK